MRRSIFVPESRTSARLLRHLGEAVAQGVDDKFEAIGDVELGEDRAEVVSHGRFAYEKSFADEFVLKAFRNERHNLSFAWRETADLDGFGIRSFVLFASDVFQHA